MDNKSFGQQLRLIRKQHKMTVETLAELLDISDKAVWNIENGNRSTSLDVLVKICNIFHVSPEFLLAKDLDENLEHPISQTDKLYQLILELTPGEQNQFTDFIELTIKNRTRYQ